MTALLDAQLKEHAIPLARERIAEAVRLAVADDRHTLVLVSRQDGRPVGVAYLSFGWILERGGPAMFLEELYVVPELRERRIGSALLGKALEVARARGCWSAELEVEGSHARAANLYARAGFRPLERVHWTLPLD
ncbi:MAG TPA: GNAT family N-acetyltransferase [Myxococcaceae bacterium]